MQIFFVLILMLSDNLPFSAACERNKDPILSVIAPYLAQSSMVLEIGSGTAQHAVYFAKAFPDVKWQTSDQAHYVEGIQARLMAEQMDNVIAPVVLDVNQPVWFTDKQQFDLIYSANTLHIMSDDDVTAFFNGLSAVTSIGSHLIIYGPFIYQGQFTSDSNAWFDQDLRTRGVGSSIKEFDLVNQLAKQQGFVLQADHAMPANNQCLIWEKQSDAISEYVV